MHWNVTRSQLGGKKGTWGGGSLTTLAAWPLGRGARGACLGMLRRPKNRKFLKRTIQKGNEISAIKCGMSAQLDCWSPTWVVDAFPRVLSQVPSASVAGDLCTEAECLEPSGTNVSLVRGEPSLLAFLEHL